MPQRETRIRIEQALRAKQAQTRISVEVVARALGLRRDEIENIVRRSSLRRPPGMAPALVTPPRGPLPLQGGASAPLEFDD